MLILNRSAIWQEAELSKCGGGWLSTAAVCVEGKVEREVGSRGGNRLCTRKRHTREQNTTNIIVNVLSENDNASK